MVPAVDVRVRLFLRCSRIRQSPVRFCILDSTVYDCAAHLCAYGYLSNKFLDLESDHGIGMMLFFSRLTQLKKKMKSATDVIALMRAHLSVDQMNEAMEILKSVALENPHPSEAQLLPRKIKLLSAVQSNDLVFKALQAYFGQDAVRVGQKRGREEEIHDHNLTRSAWPELLHESDWELDMLVDGDLFDFPLLTTQEKSPPADPGIFSADVW